MIRITRRAMAMGAWRWRDGNRRNVLWTLSVSVSINDNDNKVLNCILHYLNCIFGLFKLYCKVVRYSNGQSKIHGHLLFPPSLLLSLSK